MGKSIKRFVVDVHKDSNDLASGEEQGEDRHYRAIGGEMSVLARTVRKLESLGRPLVSARCRGWCARALWSSEAMGPGATPRALMNIAVGYAQPEHCESPALLQAPRNRTAPDLTPFSTAATGGTTGLRSRHTRG